MCLAALPCVAQQNSSPADTLHRAFEQTIYQLEASAGGTYQGENPAQGLGLEFNSHEVRLKNPSADVGLRLTGYGYGSRVLTPPPAKLKASGARVEYQRAGITEWYVNDPRGLEQGFTLFERPGTPKEGERLTISVGVSGGLRPVLSSAGDAVLLQSSEGGHKTVLRYAGLHARDARGREVASRLEVDRDIRLVIEDAAAEYPLVVDPVVTATWPQQAELTAADGASNDSFGYSVAVNGSTAVVGAWAKTVSSTIDQGAAYVFVRSGATWTQQPKLTASDGAANDSFGLSVSVSGGIIVVGAHGKTVNSNATQGAAYIFVQNGSTWSQQAKLTAADGAAGDHFGYSVSVNGATAVVGAYQKAVNSNPQQGAAYVFVQSGSTWTQQQKLTASDGAAGDNFGNSVSVSGTTVVAGAWQKTINANVSQGAAYVFTQSGTTWTQQPKLTASDGAAGDVFGVSVSVSGGTALVGANAKNSYQGAAYVFTQAGAAWSQQAELTASDGATNDGFGVSVALNGATAVVGASGKTVASSPGQGVAYVFAGSGGSWSQQPELTSSDGTTGDRFGLSVAVSGGSAVVGAGYKAVSSNPAQGAAYVFAQAPSSTTLSASPNPAAFSSAVTLTATVSPTSATGTVTFYDGTTVLGSAPVSTGVAQFSTSMLAAGSRSLTAQYVGAGSAAYASSVSAVYTETVQTGMALSQSVLNFGSGGGVITDPQFVTVSFTNSAAISWTAASSQSNVTVSPTSGVGLKTLQITASAGPSATVTVTAPGASNSPQSITVNVATVTPGSPFGSFDTPSNGATGLSGSIAVTGWALDNIEVTGVDIWREPVAGEPASPALILIGNATFVAGARPDVQALYPTTPFNYQAGWGYLLLTNELPNNGSPAGIGNGTYKIHAIAHNKTGVSLDLGTKTITVNNAAATLPFGAIDTPGQGATVSGTVTNFGWALTPPTTGCPMADQPCIIPTNGSTIFVFVDGASLGNPVYNLARCDVDQLFPGYANSGSTNCAQNGIPPGPVGYFNLDTTQLTNGVHTIAWSVTDNAGKAQGIGSRYFTVEN